MSNNTPASFSPASFSDVLARICTRRLLDVQEQMAACSTAQMWQKLRDAPQQARGFAAALQAKAGHAVIAEFKRASPSQGVISATKTPQQQAGLYALGGAAALSVLTEPHFFKGSNEDLQAARQAVSLPVLRKDFMVHPWQILESKLLGSDAILLILAWLDDHQAQEMEQLAMELGMDVLIETHSMAEIERAMQLKSPLIGVNNRNLKTLAVDQQAFTNLAQYIGQGRVIICESGIESPQAAFAMAKAGADAFLIGSWLMREQDPSGALAHMISAIRQ
ncbi:MAG: indole-3-glycerol phosphate synthase TrpC [Alphaproteobacteria bacterium]